MSATTITVPDYEQAKEIYRRLCAKSRRLFNRESDEGHALCSIVQAMSSGWDFSTPGPSVSDLKHLNAQDRHDCLALFAYLTGEDGSKYFPRAFEEIHHEAFASL